jgi:TP901 family phage tail tape measure protein
MANKYAVETAFKLIDKATEPLAKIGVKGNAVGKALKKDFMKAQDQLAGIGKAAKKAGLAIAAVGVAAAGAFAVKGVKDAIEFNTAFTKVSTIADTAKVSLDKLSKGLIEVSNITGVAAKDLANMQYDAIASGISTADSVDFLATAVKASKAAFTETGTVIDALTSVMNAYSMKASEAGKIAGQMLVTNNLGKTSFDELNSALGKVLPTASRLNVGTDELFSSIAALTANSIKTPKAVKGLEKILETIQKPTDSAAKAARRLGIDFSVSALRSKGLAGFLKEIQEKTGGSEEAIMSLFGSVESLNAITVLTGKGAGQFTEALEQMQNASGVVDTAFNKVMASPAERWGVIMNKIKNAGINLGTALLPVVEKVMTRIGDFVDKLKDYDFTPIADKVGVTFGIIFGIISKTIKFLWSLRYIIIGIAAAWGIYKAAMIAAVIISNIMGMVKAVQSLMAAQKGMNAVQAIFNVLLAANPIGIVIIAIGVLIGLFILLYKKCEPFRNAVNGLFEKFKQFASHILDVFSPAIGVFQGVWEKIQSTFGSVGGYIGRIFSLFLNLFGAVGKGTAKFSLLDIVLKYISTSIQVTGSLFGGLVETIGALFEGINNIIDAFSNGGFLAGIKQMGISLLNFVLTPLKGILDALSHIPGVGKLASAGLEKLEGFTGKLNEITEENTGRKIVQKVVPAGVTNVTPRTITQTAAVANAAASIPSYGIDNRNNRTITAAATPPTAPMTTAEQYMYSQTTSREQVDIGVKAEPGTSARAIRKPRSPDVRLDVSGSNNG